MNEKYRIYIDEVGNSDLKNSKDTNQRYLSLTGVIFENKIIAHNLAYKLERIKYKYFNSHPDEPLILHRKEIVNKKHPFAILKNPKIEISFNQELLNLLENLEYKIITILIDKYEHKNLYNVWTYDPYHYCLAIMLERYQRFLSLKNSVGDVMIESRGAKEDLRLKKSYSKIYNEGTNFIRAEYFRKHFTSKELKVKPKSANIAGLQIADLIAYPARQYILEQYEIQIKKKQTFNDEIVKIIRKKFLDFSGRQKGYGIKILP